jgi:hypothetical protein
MFQLKGPMRYVMVQREDVCIYLFGDYHRKLPQTELLELPSITDVLEDLSRITKDRIHVYLEYADEPEYRNFNTDSYLKDTILHFEDCLEPKGQTVLCDLRYPMVRFHYIDDRRERAIVDRQRFLDQIDALMQRYRDIQPLLHVFKSHLETVQQKVSELGKEWIPFLSEMIEESSRGWTEMHTFLIELITFSQDCFIGEDWLGFREKTNSDEFHESLSRVVRSTISYYRLSKRSHPRFYSDLKLLQHKLFMINVLIMHLETLSPDFNTLMRMFAFSYHGEYPKKMVYYGGNHHVDNLLGFLLQVGFVIEEQDNPNREDHVEVELPNLEWLHENNLYYLIEDEAIDTQFVTVSNLTLWETSTFDQDEIEDEKDTINEPKSRKSKSVARNKSKKRKNKSKRK